MENLKEHEYLKTFDKGLEKDFEEKFWTACVDAEKKVEYSFKNEADQKAYRLLSIFGHHLNSLLSNLDMCRELLAEGKRTQTDFSERAKTVREEFENAIDYIEGVLSGNPSDRVEFHEYGTKVVFVAVKEGNWVYKIRRLLRKDGVQEETKRVRSILKCGGPYYFNEMLEELRTGEYKRWYYAVD